MSAPKGRRRRASEAQVERRKRRILEILIKKREVTIKDLAEFSTACDYRDAEEALRKLISEHRATVEACARLLNAGEEADLSEKTLRDFIHRYHKQTLCTLDVPVDLHGDAISLRTMEMAERWRNTQVGARLADKAGMETKGTLAEKVVDIIRDSKDPIRSILLSSGTSVYKVAEALFRRREEHSVRRVHSTSLLALDAFLFSNPADTYFSLLGKEFIRTTGALKDAVRDQRETFTNVYIAASVIGFTGLSKKGFYVDEEWEKEEMFALLRPNRDCRLIIIPIEWNKIGSREGHLVEVGDVSGDAVLDFLKNEANGQVEREYVVVTAPLDSDPRKQEVIAFWQDKGMTVVMA